MSENKHSASDLVQMQALPLDAKIRMTKNRIQQWYDSWKRWEIYNKITGKTRYVTSTEEPPLNEDEYIESATPGWVYVSFSGGKDSSVLKHLVDSMYSDVPSVFVNTGLEYPEIQSFVRQIKSGKYDCFNTDVEIVRPEMRFDEVLKNYGYPIISKDIAQAVFDSRTQAKLMNVDVRKTKLYNRRFNPESDYCKKYPSYCCKRYDFLFDAPFGISRRCCDVMKKKPAKQYEKKSGRMPILGTLATESVLRRTNWMMYGCNSFDGKKSKSQPLSFWTEQDILDYLKTFNVPYCSVYGDIVFDDGKLKTSGVYRTGCMFCMFGVHLEKEPNRFQRMKETHPKQYEYMLKPISEGGLGMKEVLDYIGVKY